MMSFKNTCENNGREEMETNSEPGDGETGGDCIGDARALAQVEDTRQEAGSRTQRSNEDKVLTPPAMVEGAVALTEAEEATRAFDLLKENIRGLVKFVLEKNNIHKELKTKARATERALNQYMKTRLAGLRAGESVASVCQACQTSPIFRLGSGNRERQDRTPPPSRAQAPAKKARNEARNAAPPAVPSTSEQTARAPTAEWTTVVKKGKENKKKKKKERPQDQERVEEQGTGRPGGVEPHPKIRMRLPRPDAIKIKASADGSYADILRKVKGASDLKALGDRVTRIRRTRAGELLLELGRPGTVTTELQAQVSSTLSGSAEVQLLTHKESIIIKDMDESTTAPEIAEAITAKIGPNIVTPGSITIRKSYSGTLAATIQLPAVAVKKLLKDGKLKIGWVNCRVRLREGPSRCYRCHETGHIARDCKSEVDRSKQCFRCGQEDHKAMDCRAKVKATQKAGVPTENG